MIMLTLTLLREANVKRQQEWDAERVLKPTFFAIELAGEVGEVCNVVKKLEREQYGIPGSRVNVDDLADELADVIIVADLLAERYGIDLEVAVARKFNKTSRARGFRTVFANVPEPT